VNQDFAEKAAAVAVFAKEEFPGSSWHVRAGGDGLVATTNRSLYTDVGSGSTLDARSAREMLAKIREFEGYLQRAVAPPYVRTRILAPLLSRAGRQFYRHRDDGVPPDRTWDLPATPKSTFEELAAEMRFLQEEVTRL